MLFPRFLPLNLENQNPKYNKIKHHAPRLIPIYNKRRKKNEIKIQKYIRCYNSKICARKIKKCDDKVTSSLCSSCYLLADSEIPAHHVLTLQALSHHPPAQLIFRVVPASPKLQVDAKLQIFPSAGKAVAVAKRLSILRSFAFFGSFVELLLELPFSRLFPLVIFGNC
jgi:hypothetical protein